MFRQDFRANILPSKISYRSLWGKNLVDGEMLCLGTVSTNLFRLFYAGEIQNLNAEGWKWQLFFFDSWVRFGSEGKAVALQYHEQ